MVVNIGTLAMVMNNYWLMFHYVPRWVLVPTQTNECLPINHPKCWGTCCFNSQQNKFRSLSCCFRLAKLTGASLELLALVLWHSPWVMKLLGRTSQGECWYVSSIINYCSWLLVQKTCVINEVVLWFSWFTRIARVIIHDMGTMIFVEPTWIHQLKNHMKPANPGTRNIAPKASDGSCEVARLCDSWLSH